MRLACRGIRKPCKLSWARPFKNEEARGRRGKKQHLTTTRPRVWGARASKSDGFGISTDGLYPAARRKPGTTGAVELPQKPLRFWTHLKHTTLLEIKTVMRAGGFGKKPKDPPKGQICHLSFRAF